MKETKPGLHSCQLQYWIAFLWILILEGFPAILPRGEQTQASWNLEVAAFVTLYLISSISLSNIVYFGLFFIMPQEKL